jgi:ABC-type bacteriocin/lantibiotic exporter with double-glycine peptidase domain
MTCDTLFSFVSAAVLVFFETQVALTVIIPTIFTGGYIGYKVWEAEIDRKKELKRLDKEIAELRLEMQEKLRTLREMNDGALRRAAILKARAKAVADRKRLERDLENLRNAPKWGPGPKAAE